MAHQYSYLKLLLRNNLLLDLDEYDLIDTVQRLGDTVQKGLVCGFMGVHLASAFQPVLRADGKVAGREALLRASTQELGELAAEAAFDNAVGARRLVQFDRLVRTIHLLNHSNNFDEQELLFLKVHPLLLSSVNDHGRTFEQILHYYSVPTSLVVIEIKESAVKDEARLKEAVSNYRSLGYKIAVDNFGASYFGMAAHSSMDKVFNLRPDIVKLNGGLIRKAEHSYRVESLICGLAEIFHKLGAQVHIEGIETAGQAAIARDAGADLLQGYYLGRPEFGAISRGPLCRNERVAA